MEVMKVYGSELLPCVVAVFTLFYLGQPSQAASSPILIIPGISGSRLDVRDDKRNSFCSTRHKYLRIWIKLTRLLFYNSCAKTELKLDYDPLTDSYKNNSQVKIHVPGFGQTTGVEYLSTGWINLIPYMHSLVEYFVKRGYIRGESIRAAPYDWRLAAAIQREYGKSLEEFYEIPPGQFYRKLHKNNQIITRERKDELDKRGYYNQVKSLIEEMYRNNGQQKVTIVVHSLGGPVSLYFLTSFPGVNQRWKDKYINAWVTLAGAWSGGVSTLPIVITGAWKVSGFFEFANDLLSKFFFPIGRTLESLPWIFPKSSVFGNKVLISTPSKDYTANDYRQLFSDVGYTYGYRMFEGVQRLNQGYPTPNVRMYCYYGGNVKTPVKFTYGSNFKGRNTIAMEPSKIEYGDGDGSVNLVSSEVCHKWKNMPSPHLFTHKKYDKAGHASILKNTQVLGDIATIVRARPPTTSFWER